MAKTDGGEGGCDEAEQGICSAAHVHTFVYSYTVYFFPSFTAKMFCYVRHFKFMCRVRVCVCATSHIEGTFFLWPISCSSEL